MNDKGQLGNGEYGDSGEFTNAEDAAKFTPVMVSGKKLQIKPEQVKIYPSATKEFTVSFKRFNLFSEGETVAGDYEWSIVDERDEQGAEKPGEILQFATQGGQPIAGMVQGKGIGTAKVKAVDKTTGHEVFASVEVVALGSIRPLDIKVVRDTADAITFENAVKSKKLDADEYKEISS